MWHSKSDLNGSAEVKQVDSSFAKSKQMLLSSWMNEWRKVWVLILHDSCRKSNCHWWCKASTVPKSARKWWILASKRSNYACGSMIDQEQGKVCEENWRKVREKVWRVLRIRSRSEPNEMLIMKTVMIMFIYGFLMMLLITIKQMQVN